MKNIRTEYDKYLGHAHRTRTRKDRLGNKILFLLTFEDWKQIWDESGQAENRGTRRGQYCMARFDDLGHYEVGNVKIQLSSENLRDAALRGHPCHDKGKKRGPMNAETKAKLTAIRRERRWSSSTTGPDRRKQPMSEERKQHLSAVAAAKRAAKAV